MRIDGGALADRIGPRTITKRALCTATKNINLPGGMLQSQSGQLIEHRLPGNIGRGCARRAWARTSRM
eukprot:4773214-Pyramimonas_sp.AAC.1